MKLFELLFLCESVFLNCIFLVLHVFKVLYFLINPLVIDQSFIVFKPGESFHHDVYINCIDVWIHDPYDTSYLKFTKLFFMFLRNVSFCKCSVHF